MSLYAEQFKLPCKLLQLGQNMPPSENFTEKQQKAFTLLAEKGIKPASYNPPLMRLLGRLGMVVRPPHFMPFWYGTLVFGVYFAVIWGLFMWLFVWPGQSMPFSEVAAQAGMAGAAFGVLMATWYQFGRRKHTLPRWEDL